MSEHRQVTAVSHPRASSWGCVYEHILIAERALGRYLLEGAEVHHADENKRNNTNRNLVICQDKAYHKLLHVRARVVRAGGNPDTQRICSMCHAVLPMTAFNRASSNIGSGTQKACRECMRTYNRSYVRPSKRGRAA